MVSSAVAVLMGVSLVAAGLEANVRPEPVNI
jgi:hypothetical protein